MLKIKKDKMKEEIKVKKAAVLLALAVNNEKLIAEIKNIINKVEGASVVGQAENIDEIFKAIGEDNKDIDIIVLSTDIPTDENLMYVTKKIPREIRIIAVDTAKVNKLVYGKLEEDGVEFIEELEDLEKHIFLEDEVEEDSEEKSEKDKKKKLKKIPQQPDTQKKSIKKKRGKNYIITDLIKKQKGDSNLQFKEVVRSVETTKHAVIKQQKVIYKHPKDYKKTIALFSPLSTGKTELASNIAKALSEKGKKVILLDLDFEKYGLLYNFKISSGENNENFFKYRYLFKKVSEYINSNSNFELNNKVIERLAAYKGKNLLVYTGHIEVSIKDKGEIRKRANEIFDSRDFSVKDSDIEAMKESYIQNNIKIEPETLSYIIKKFKSIGDVIVVDVGKKLPYDLMKVILDIDNLEKILVTTQNIEHLNSIPCLFKLKSDVDFYDWTIAVNKYREIKEIKDNSISSYFEDNEGKEKSFKIKDQFIVPYSFQITENKANRDCVYGKDKRFDNSIDNIVNTCLGIQSYKDKEGLFNGFLAKFRKGS